MGSSLLSPLDCDEIRRAFPALKDVVYLNAGSYSLMPEPALAVLLQTLAEFERTALACPTDLRAKTAALRSRIAALIGADPEEIALTANATEGNNLVLAGLDWRPGDEVITTDEEHPALQYPLLYLQQRKGIRLRLIQASPDAGLMLQRLEEVARPATRLVAVSHVTCETGTRLPARDICRWAAARGIRTLVDGAHVPGVFPLDVRDLGCDYYVSNGHKWLCGPKGSGIFYGRRDRLAELSPAHVGDCSLQHADLAAGVAELWPTAARFEFGTRAWPLHGGLYASLDWLEALGWARIEQHMAALSGYLRERILERPYLRLLTPLAWPDSSPLTSVVVAGQDADALHNALRQERGIHVRCVSHYNAIRISTAHFNNQADIDALLLALDERAG